MFKNYSISVILTITIISIMGVSTILPALPDIQTVFMLNTEQVGWILTVFTLPGVFLAPIAGILLDKYGRRAVLIPSLVTFGVAGVACAFAPSFEILLLLRCVQGVGLSALNLLTNVLITDTYTGTERIRMLGYNAMVLGFGTGFMPFVGGILAEIHWSLPFIMAGIALPVAVCSWFITYPPITKVTSLATYFADAKNAISSWRVLWLFILALGTFLIVYGPIATYYPLYANDVFHLSPFWIGITYGSFAFSTAYVSIKLPKLLRYTSSLVLMRSAQILYIGSMVCFIITSSAWFFVVPLILYGFAQGLQYPNLVRLVSEEASDANRGIMLSLQGMVFRLSQTLAPLLFGVAYIQGSFRGVYVLGILVAGIMLFVSIFALKEKT